ncbi:type II toxin-antitoxin system Rv0910 family toxin [Tsukamurella pseudospumae]|uniref:Toxin n=1 Tax=Tsukamurella pseudospumae TaxID=239498 RepID=A0A138AXB0_9ACTN|nr:SRPBCC family protein [Tsukamurella pseudospumae]KXO95936.1 toxin [Tsukamurella pseudospumae]KXP15098.1 toxin [Tsukamurella pseudospumae]
MAKVESRIEIPLPPDTAWEKAADLETLPQWVTLHDGWRGPLPELAQGARIACVLKAKNFRNRVEWVITEYDPPRRLVLDGKGVAGTKYKLTVSIAPSGAGSTVALRADLGGAPLFGPIGATVARALKGDIEESLQRFQRMFAE